MEVSGVTILEEGIPQHVAEGGGEREGDPERDGFVCQFPEDVEEGQVGFRDRLVEPVFLQELVVFGVAHIREMCVEQEGKISVIDHSWVPWHPTNATCRDKLNLSFPWGWGWIPNRVGINSQPCPGESFSERILDIPPWNPTLIPSFLELPQPTPPARR